MKNESAKHDILIVDDSKIWLNKIEEILEGNNYKIRKASSLDKAIRELKRFIFKIAILDIRLVEDQEENIDGLKILKYIDESNIDTRVIIISGNAKEKDKIFATRSDSLIDFIRREEIDINKLRRLVGDSINNQTLMNKKYYKLLIVDDESIWHDKIKEILIDHNIKFSCCTDVDSAKGFLAQNEMSLILLDLCLYGDSITIDDRLFWEYLSRFYSSIPRIAISGKSLEPDSIWGLTKYGFVDFIYKSNIDIHKFRTCISRNLELSELSIDNIQQKEKKIKSHDLDQMGSSSLKEAVSKGDYDNLFTVLMNISNSNDINLLNEIIVLSAQYRWIKKQKRIGSVNFDKEKTFMNQLNMSLLDVIDQIVENNK